MHPLLEHSILQANKELPGDDADLQRLAAVFAALTSHASALIDDSLRPYSDIDTLHREALALMRNTMQSLRGKLNTSGKPS